MFILFLSIKKVRCTVYVEYLYGFIGHYFNVTAHSDDHDFNIF